jgi:regulatory protein
VNDKEAFQRARDYTFLLLKFRLRSEREVLERLSRKKFAPAVSGAVVAFLKEKGFIDDAAFARAWIDSRIRRPLGASRIRQELVLKGVDKKIIDRELKEAVKNHPEAPTVLDLARRRMEKSKGVDADVARRRIYAYLVRRGFSYGAVMDAMDKL